MNIAIPVTLATFPRVQLLIQAVNLFGPYPTRHKFVLHCSPAMSDRAWKLAEQLPGSRVETSLSGVLRSFPANVNDTFQAVARAEQEGPWLYLSPESLPVKANWTDLLEAAYRASGKKYLGAVAYAPRRVKDASGAESVDHGDPFLLEAAVYPASLTSHLTVRLRNAFYHHEQVRKHQVMPHTEISPLVCNAAWAPGFTLDRVPGDAALITRLRDDTAAEQLLSGGPVIAEPPLVMAGLATTSWTPVTPKEFVGAVGEFPGPDPLEVRVPPSGPPQSPWLKLVDQPPAFPASEPAVIEEPPAPEPTRPPIRTPWDAERSPPPVVIDSNPPPVVIDSNPPPVVINSNPPPVVINSNPPALVNQPVVGEPAKRGRGRPRKNP